MITNNRLLQPYIRHGPRLHPHYRYMPNGIIMASNCLSQQRLKLTASFHIPGLYTSHIWLQPGCTPRSILRWHWCTRSPLDGKQREKRGGGRVRGSRGTAQALQSKQPVKPPVFTHQFIWNTVWLVGNWRQRRNIPSFPLSSTLRRWISGRWHH